MTATQHLRNAIEKYTPEVAAAGRAVLKKMRARIPGAVEMVYDNYNGLVIGFSPTERPSDAVFSIILFPRWVTLCFLYGAFLDDPQKILKGSGSRVRNVRLASADDLDQPALRALIDQAIADAEGPMNRKSTHRVVIRSVQKRQRPRRPPARLK